LRKTLLTLGLGLALAAGAFAQSQKVAQSGPFAIDKISEKGRFDRCAATLQPGPNMLRIAWNKDHVYTISVPASKLITGRLKMTFKSGARDLSYNALTDGSRTWATIDTPGIEAIMSTKGTIRININQTPYSWPIGRTNMEDVLSAVEDCTWKAHGR